MVETQKTESSLDWAAVLVPAVFVICLQDIDLAVDALSFLIHFADESKAGRVVDCQEDRESFKEMLDKL